MAFAGDQPVGVSPVPSRCPFARATRLVGAVFRAGRGNRQLAEHLRVRVVRDGEERANIYLPAASARWMIDLIPQDVLARIREEDIPIDAIQQDLAECGSLNPRDIFELRESGRTVQVWLE